MGLPDSVQVSRDWTYSGTNLETSGFRLPDCHRLWYRFPSTSPSHQFFDSCRWPHNPAGTWPAVWAVSVSLAATQEIEVSFFSSGYLDVSVLRVSFVRLFDSTHDNSGISGSMLI